MSNGNIPLADLPLTEEGAQDYLVGVQGGKARRFLIPDIQAATAELDAQIDDLIAQKSAEFDADAAPVIAGLGYAVPVPYAAGILIDSTRETVEYNGQVYAPIAADLPFTTSGTFEADSFRVIQGVSITDLAAEGGAALVGIQDSESQLDASDVEGALVELAQRPVPRGRQDVASVIRRMRDGESIKVVCVGDSITYGQLDTGGTAATPWPARLQAVMQQYYGNAAITVVNKGVSGSTVGQMLARFSSDVTAESPDLVIFNGGTNDAREANSVSLADYKADVVAYLNRLRHVPTVVWGLTPRFKEQRSGDGEGVIDFYRQTLQTEAGARGIPYVDAYARLHRLYKSRAWASGMFSSDGSHYSEDGYRYLGDVIFAEAFANDDLFIRPGEFKDARGQWIITDAADSAFGGQVDNQDGQALTVTNASVRLYLFVEDWTECALAVHCLIDGTNDPAQGVGFNNTSISGTGSSGSFGTSPKPAGSAEWFAQDYAVVAVRLRPGLNNITLNTSSSFRVSGFSVIPQPRDGYLTSFNPDANETFPASYWGAALWKSSTHAFEALRNGILVVSNTASGYIEPYFMLKPDPVMTTSRWRFRATIYPGAEFHLGQQSTSAVEYMPVYSVSLGGTNIVVSGRDHNGTVRTLATVAYAFAGAKDIKVDLKSGFTGWTLWVDGTLIYTDDVPLSVGMVLVSAPGTERTYWNPPIKKGPNVSDTGVIVGETWQTFSDDKLHIVNDAAAEKTLTFA